MSETNGFLAEFVRNGSEEAFRELVCAYQDLVFSTALRLADRNRHLAEDVSQQVFIDLARKANELPEDVQLGGWLYCHTCFIARKAMRRERRRTVRERQALEFKSLADYTEENLRRIGSDLDEAINDLNVADRIMVLLRFFERQDFATIGERVGCGEDAARMRVSRAVDSLGRLLKRRGIALSGAGLIFVLSTKTMTAAPLGMALHIARFALAKASNVSLFALLKQACLTRVNIALTSAAGTVALMLLLFSGHNCAHGVQDQNHVRQFAVASAVPTAHSPGEVSDSQDSAPKNRGGAPLIPIPVRVAMAPSQPLVPPSPRRTAAPALPPRSSRPFAPSAGQAPIVTPIALLPGGGSFVSLSNQVQLAFQGQSVGPESLLTNNLVQKLKAISPELRQAITLAGDYRNLLEAELDDDPPGQKRPFRAVSALPATASRVSVLHRDFRANSFQMQQPPSGLLTKRRPHSP